MLRTSAPLIGALGVNSKMNRQTTTGLLVTVLWLGLLTLIVFWKWDSVAELRLNEIGDFLSGLSAPLALLWVVVGYFQQGEELRQNTEALKTQQEELRRQVEETQALVRNAERQANASEELAAVSKAELAKAEQREEAASVPKFTPMGGSTNGATIKTTIFNAGGRVTNVGVTFMGPHQISLSARQDWPNDTPRELFLEQAAGTPLNFPIDFGIQYTDSLNRRREQVFRMTGPHQFGQIDT